MPFSGEPTQQQVLDRMTGDVENELAGADARARFSFERIMVKVLGKASFYVHRHIAWLSRQPFADTADAKELDRLIYIHELEDGEGGTGRKPAKKSSGKLQVTGASPGTISIGDVLTRADGARFVFDANTTFLGAANEVKDLAVTADEVGSLGNADGGVTLTFEAAHTGILSDGTVHPDGLTNGAERETDDNARLRLLQLLRTPAAGGGPGDFITWALASHVNVTRAWEMPQGSAGLNPGTVLVLIANDNISPPVPDDTLVGIAQDYLQKSTTATGGWLKLTGKAPSTSTTTVQAVSTKALDYAATITLEDGVAQATAKTAIEAEVAAYIKRVAEPGITITTNQVLAAIMNAAGVKNAVLTVPALDVTHTATQIPIAGTFTPTWS